MILTKKKIFEILKEAYESKIGYDITKYEVELYTESYTLIFNNKYVHVERETDFYQSNYFNIEYGIFEPRKKNNKCRRPLTKVIRRIYGELNMEKDKTDVLALLQRGQKLLDNMNFNDICVPVAKDGERPIDIEVVSIKDINKENNRELLKLNKK